MINLNKYIIEKLKLNKDIKDNKDLPENGKILVNLLKLKDEGLIDAIAEYMDKYHIKDIVVHVNERGLYKFINAISIKWDGKLNQDIFKGEKSFLTKDDVDNFDLMRWIINGSHDYSKLDNILLYESGIDNIALYGSEWGLYLKHKDYELIVLYDKHEKDK
jgi:hypothetical protein